MSDDLFIIFVACIIVNFVTAFGFAHIAGEKGYSKAGYWFWCFLGGIAGWLMVVALPDRPERKNDASKAPRLPNR